VVAGSLTKKLKIRAAAENGDITMINVQ